MAATLVSFGIDPTPLLTTEDEDLILSWRAIADRAEILVREHRKDLAARIANYMN